MASTRTWTPTWPQRLTASGGKPGVRQFAATPDGYIALLAWLESFGTVTLVGVEGTGSYGAGLTRHLQAAGVKVVEIDRPDRQKRRRAGKSDPIDAVAAARAALSGEATTQAKTRTGAVEAIRVLRVARCSARHDKAEALNQMRSLVCTAPDAVREPLRDLTGHQLVVACAALRPGAHVNVVSATKTALRELARRVQFLAAQIKSLDRQLRPLVAATAPAMVARHGVGTDTAGALLVAAGDNPDRLRHEAAFAHLCGSAPIEASSGKVVRHRLNRNGDRQANHALWRIAMTRMSSHPETRAYVIKRTADGKSKRDILRCLKRAIAREMFPPLTTEKVD